MLQSRNQKNSVLLDPDHYDILKGWMIYQVASDDPGLSKPAYLACKNAEYPDPQEVEALEYYVEHFVWGKLQRTEEEEYPYAIYGIPNWKYLRGLKNISANEKYHIWRLYDYPHIALLYYKLYQIGRSHPEFDMKLPPETYLKRAYGTYLALYQYPPEIDQWYDWTRYWSPYKTGLFNELVIEEVIEALAREGFLEKARRLEYHWQHKAEFFIRENKDLFGSEFAFDTTGFESTEALALWGRKHAVREYLSEPRSLLGYTLEEVEEFALRQKEANIACRGYVENAYYMTGSDIRGQNTRVLLTYMSQMGGWGLQEEALYGAEKPFELLRLASTSMLSSWAIMNAGDEESNYGYWFPGEEINGDLSMQFSPVPYGVDGFGLSHARGPGVYSSEGDLGPCGAIRGAATILAEDPDFGTICYGGLLREEGQEKEILLRDGIERRFHWITKDDDRFHLILENAHFEKIVLEEDGKIHAFLKDVAPKNARMRVFGKMGWKGISLEEQPGVTLYRKEEELAASLCGEVRELVFSWKKE